MREIKFRAWGEDEKVMMSHEDIIRFEMSYEQVTTAEVPIMQYTGLKDKSGVEIYEGDIYKFQYTYDADYDGDMPIEKTASGKKVITDIRTALDETKRIFAEHGTIEVIGNIYENPELIGGTE